MKQKQNIFLILLAKLPESNMAILRMEQKLESQKNQALSFQDQKTQLGKSKSEIKKKSMV